MQRSYLTVHGHFYQPPRENAWTREVYREPSATPSHDWNERILTECYRTNAFARLPGKAGKIEKLVNNYEWMSFNFGPTLLAWLEVADPRVYEAILDADRRSLLRWGHGNAIAQAYNHVILPLAEAGDRRLQIQWGIQDFRRRFGREPESMWLPETAVDTATLDELIVFGMRFVILSPFQAQRIRHTGGDWVAATELNTQRPYWYCAASGRKIAIFFYDAELSSAASFGGLMNNAGHFVDSVRKTARGQPGLVSIATDGELYGHHRKFAELALAYAFERLLPGASPELINYGAFLDLEPPRWEVEILAGGSSWSCAHGVERWRSDCGCSTGGEVEWTQNWRRPLREALDWLGTQVRNHYTDSSEGLLADPEAAMGTYTELAVGQGRAGARRWLQLNGGDAESQLAARCLRMAEARYQAQLMFTSCGWFFAELSGLETVLVLSHAARALDLIGNENMHQEFEGLLARARGNRPEFPNGEVVWRRLVLPLRVTAEKAAAMAVLRGRLERGNGLARVPGFKVAPLSAECDGQMRVAVEDVAGVRNCVIDLASVEMAQGKQIFEASSPGRPGVPYLFSAADLPSDDAWNLQRRRGANLETHAAKRARRLFDALAERVLNQGQSRNETAAMWIGENDKLCAALAILLTEPTLEELVNGWPLSVFYGGGISAHALQNRAYTTAAGVLEQVSGRKGKRVAAIELLERTGFEASLASIRLPGEKR